MRAAGAVDAGQGGAAFAGEFGVAMDFVRMIDAGVGGTKDAGGDSDEIVVANGAEVLAGTFVDDEKRTLSFEIAIADPARAKQFGTRVLKILPVFRVVQIAEGVALRVTNAEIHANRWLSGVKIGSRFRHRLALVVTDRTPIV